MSNNNEFDWSGSNLKPVEGEKVVPVKVVVDNNKGIIVDDKPKKPFKHQLFAQIDKEFHPPEDDGSGWKNSEWRDEWREQVLEDWDHQCVICGDDEYLEAHHLNGQKDHPLESDDPDNGVILCHDCHVEFHRWNGGFGSSCSKDDFEKWRYG